MTNYNGSSVTKLNASDGALVGTYTVGSNPLGIAFDGANIWVANTAATPSPSCAQRDRPGHLSPSVPAPGIAFDGANIWVTNNGSGTVTMIPAQ